jgi:hypothetical protein
VVSGLLGLGPWALGLACPVCFGGDDVVVRESLNAGIGVLLGVTAVVLAGFLRFFIRLARRSRENAHLVEERHV